jgi:hypothetical protein
MPRAFKINSIDGPAGIGPLDSYYHFYVDFEFDPGEPFEHRIGRATIHLMDREAHTIAMGQVDQDRYREVALARVAYFATLKLSSILSSPDPDLRQLISPTNEEVRMLLDVDPKRVSYGEWIGLTNEGRTVSRDVFISCGQQTPEEIELGNTIAALVEEETSLKGYFAEYQASLEGLTQNIFNALYNSSGFIAVMHHRDELSLNEYRGSVWVEQELAIAAFIVQTLGISLPSRAYIQRGIRREGVRGFIILNPIEFDTNEEVLDDLRGWLPALASATGE